VSGVISIRSAIGSELVAQARQEPHLECCGMLAGHHGVITHAFPATNVSVEPARNYEIAPKEIVRLMREFRTAGLEFLGIYHSHPTSKNEPSARDIELAYYSEEAYFIVSPRDDAPQPVRAFHIRDGRASELEIKIV
jgi:proteasome lid subunit RPN8/RPN11